MTADVLLLNADYSPIKIISWEKAVCLFLAEKVMIVEDYAGRIIRSTSMQVPWPAVVALKKYVRMGSKVRFNRANLLARDRYTCQYCGRRPKTPTGLPNLAELTLDHVVPRAQAREGFVVLPWNGRRVPVTCWENIVAACYDCNSAKADNTPKQAKLKLRVFPKRPSPWDALRMVMGRAQVPTEWDEYVPEGWRNYYNVELDPG